MWARIRTWLVALTVGVVGVAGCTAVNRVLPAPAPTAPWVEVYGSRVFYNPDAKLPMSEADLKRAFEAAAKYWGTPVEALKGWVLVQRSHDPWDVGDVWVWGITYMDIRRVDFSSPRPDCMALVLVHEWGHAGAGNRGHDDVRFDDPAIWKFLQETGVCPAE